MSLKKIVGGNTLYIEYKIRKNSNTKFDNLTVFLLDVFKKKQKINYEISENDNSTEVIINIKYEGSNQRTFGKFSVVVFNNYNEENQQCLVYKDAFILVHALKNRVSCFGDDILDSSGVKIEIDSDLSVDFNDQRIRDFDTIMENISEIQNSIDNIQEKIDFSGINSSINILDSSVNYIIDDVSEIQGSLETLDSSVNYIIDDISEIQGSLETLDSSVNYMIDDVSEIRDSLDILWEKIDDFSDINSSINILDNSVNYIIDDIGKTEKTLVEYFTIIDNSVNMLMNTSMDSTYDDTSLTNYLNNVSTRVNNLSTNQDQLETYIQNNRKHIIENENNISEISTIKIPTINTSINDLSTFMARLDASLQILWNSSQN